MSESIWKPHVTVAAIAERDGRFLLVEESIDGRMILNQPAGHLDDNESLLQAVVREVREESAWEFSPEFLVGLYLWKAPEDGSTFLRIAFSGRCRVHHDDEPLDKGVARALWLSRDEVAADASRLRSPMVLRCIDDYVRGMRAPLELLQDLGFRAPFPGT